MMILMYMPCMLAFPSTERNASLCACCTNMLTMHLTPEVILGYHGKQPLAKPYYSIWAGNHTASVLRAQLIYITGSTTSGSHFECAECSCLCHGSRKLTRGGLLRCTMTPARKNQSGLVYCDRGLVYCICYCSVVNKGHLSNYFPGVIIMNFP